MDGHTGYYLNGVGGTSGSEVFVVGNGDTILHYNGSLWQTMQSGDYVYLNDIWGTSSHDIFVIGTGCSTTFQQVFNLYPESPDFGAIVVGGSITLEQTVNFTAIQGCGEQLYIESIGVMGKHATEFDIQDTQCKNSNYYGESYSYCQFKTVFTPSSLGEKQAELIFKLSRAELPGHVVPLLAEGIDSSLARLELTPTEYDFGTVFVNRGSTPQSFAIKNTGTVSLKLGNIMLTGEHANEFSLENWWCTAIDILHPGAQCDINVWFLLTSGGQKQARLTIILGGLTAEALLKGIAEEPKDCSDANITIKSAQSGHWNVPATWSTSQISTETDVVRINSGHTITGQAFAKVRTFCVQEGGVLESADERGTPLEIQATDYLENKGIIRGKNGTNQTKPGVVKLTLVRKVVLSLVQAFFLKSEPNVRNGAKALAGKGGNCNPQGSQQTGGNLWLVSLPDVHIEGGITEAGSGGQGCTVNGQNGFVQIEPNIISLAGAATQVSGGNIAIYGGNDWTLDLSNLSGTVVEATGDITLAVVKEGLIDFRNSTGKILKAGDEVQIFANNILLDPDKKILDYIEAKNVVLGPSRILRNVSLTGPGKLFGKPGDTLPIQLILANNGPEDDNYLVTATDSTGQNIGQLPQVVPVKGLETINVEINTVVPATNPIIYRRANVPSATWLPRYQAGRLG